MDNDNTQLYKITYEQKKILGGRILRISTMKSNELTKIQGTPQYGDY